MAASKGNTIELPAKPNAKGTPLAAAGRSPEALAKVAQNKGKAGAARKKQVDQISRKLVLTQFTYATKEVAAIRMKNATFRVTGLPELTRDNGGVRVDAKGKIHIIDPVKTKNAFIAYAMKNRNTFVKETDSTGKVKKTIKKAVYDYKWLSVAIPVNAAEVDFIGWTSAFAKKPIAVKINGKILKFKGAADIYSKIKNRADTKSDTPK